MNAIEAKALLEPIHEGLWIKGQMTDHGVRFCAVAHLFRLKTGVKDFDDMFGSNHPELLTRLRINGAKEEVDAFVRTYKFGLNVFDLSAVNDGLIPEYQQPTIKERVLAYLNDRIKSEAL